MDISIIYRGKDRGFSDKLQNVCNLYSVRYIQTNTLSQESYDNSGQLIVFSDSGQTRLHRPCCEILVMTSQDNPDLQLETYPLDIIYSNCPETILQNKLNLYLNNLEKSCNLVQHYKSSAILAAKEKIIIDRFSRISKISRKVNSLDIDQIAMACIYDIPEIFHATYASLYTYNKETNCLHLTRHNHPHKISSLVNVGDNPDRPMSQAIKNKKLMIIEDLDNHSFDASADNETTRYRTKSCVIAPIISSDGVLGVLNLADKYDMSNFEKQTDLPALELLCEIIGAALYNIELYQKVNQKAQTDGMTGLVNHTTFYKILKRELRRFERYGKKLTLLMIDLDGLKQINDKHGHIAGDMVIKHVAKSIKNCIRQTDIAARYGGDEFAIILPETKLTDAEIIADRLLIEVENNLVNFKGQTLKATISIGVGESEKGQSVEDFVDNIDGALFTAKESGKNRRIIV